ncbi:Leucine-rich repeat-containing protein 56 [Phytophthora ramorum]|uniref:Leucine-rich repeat-containing protein 56 n=1 Tax=Phytophthora ramorum TaxID=164328 RepID=UPI0030A26FAA|nr:Leucine-rich repeat-containing protein 56 [Phytophthora ramorum]
MITVAVGDQRHEMDANVAASPPTKRKPSANVKTSFLIRTLPRECNPTPVPTGGLSASASGLLSPLKNKLGGRQEADLEILQQDNPFDDITEEKLKQLTGSQDLARVASLQISIDSTKQSVEVIGELLPTLRQLRLQQSTLSSFRDLGTSLGSLRVLWAMHSQISDLDGIGALMNLQELYLQHNNVSDITPLALHEELRVIDLEGNRVADIGQLEQLAFCPQLTSLNLTGNPVETVEQYRQIAANFVPQLAALDDRAFSDTERAKLSDAEIDAALLKHRELFQADATHKQQLERSIASRKRGSEKFKGDDDGSSDSDADDESSASPAVATGFSCPTLVPKTAFFNVAESLNAIEKWRDEMEYDAEDTEILSVASLQQSCLSPRSAAGPEVEPPSISIPGQIHAASGNQQHSPTRHDLKPELGPGNVESDRHLVQLLNEKHGQLKTRDGFRSYFRGIEEERLEGILRQAFADIGKVRRRMQLMSGFFSHEL